MSFETPPPLERGDRIAVVAPSSGAAAEVSHVYERGLQRLREVFDLEPVEFPTTTKDSEYLAAHPEERARDIEEAFADPDIRGAIATIGGDDQLRILRHLDPGVLQEHPTRFFGYSDNTNLALYLWNLGIVSYQGPAVLVQLAMGGGMHEYTVEGVERAFFEESIGAVEPAKQFTDETLDWADPANLERSPELEANPGWRWHDPAGSEPVTGRLWGGCLETLSTQLMAGRYLPEPEMLDGAVLFFETSEELRAASWVKEVLLSMGERGLLERFDAVLVGRAKTRTHLENPPPEERAAHRSRQREAIREVLEIYTPEIPVVFEFDCGHTDPIVPVPIGAEATVDPREERVAFH